MTNHIEIMTTLAVEVAFKRAILPSWAAAGYGSRVEWAPTSVLMERILAGARADIVVMIDEQMAKLAASGIVRKETITPLARAEFGVAVLAGAPRPDISSPEAFCQALVEARSIAFSATGASGIYFAQLIRRLNIAEIVEPRAVIIPSGFTAERLVSGECDLAVQQVSEMMSVDGVEVVGPFPEPFQKPTDFSVAMFSDATDEATAARFIAHLSTSEAGRAYNAGGLISRLRPQPALSA